MNNNADKNYGSSVILVVLFALITLSCFHSAGQGDVKFWLNWMKVVDNHGPFSGYELNQWDYPPLSSIILFCTAKMAHLLSIDHFNALKLSLTLFLALTSIIIWSWTRDAFITAIIHLSLMVNSLLLVYIDIYFAPFLILSLWALRKNKMTAFTILYSIACLIKWQPIIIAPFILLHILKIKKIADWKEIDLKTLSLNVLLPAVIIFLITLSLFNLAFLKSFASALNEVHLSGNALNLGWIMTYLLHVFFPDIFGPLIEGRADYIITPSQKIMLIPKSLFLIFYTGTFLSFFKEEKTYENLINYSLIGFLAYFIFNTGAHENHLFIAAILAGILFFINKDHLVTSAYIIIMSNFNLIIFYGFNGKGLGFSRVAGVDITFLFSILNVVFFLLIWKDACVQRRKTGVA